MVHTHQTAVMLELPNELLCEIATNLAPLTLVSKDGGYGALSVDDAASRHAYAKATLDLINLSVVCKRLTSVAQDILYRTVSLLQSAKHQKPGKRYPSSLSRFFRTVLSRPGLAAHVTSLTVWIWKGKAVDQQDAPTVQSPACACEDCKHKLSVAVDKLHLKPDENSKWKSDLSHPTEAMVTGLVLAALSNVNTVALYARPFPDREEIWAGYRDPNLSSCMYDPPAASRSKLQTLIGSHADEVLAISQGLATTNIHTLTLSASLNGLHRARLPSLETLSLDYSGPNPFVTVAKGTFRNVKTLKFLASGEDLIRANKTFSAKANIVLKGLPSVREVHFECTRAVDLCKIPAYVENVVVQSTD